MRCAAFRSRAGPTAACAAISSRSRWQSGSLMTALSGAAQNFWQLLGARVGIGAGEAGSIPPAQSMICDFVPPKRRAGVFAVNNFGLIVGLIVGMALAGWLGESLGWRVT